MLLPYCLLLIWCVLTSLEWTSVLLWFAFSWWCDEEKNTLTSMQGLSTILALSPEENFEKYGGQSDSRVGREFDLLMAYVGLISGISHDLLRIAGVISEHRCKINPWALPAVAHIFIYGFKETIQWIMKMPACSQFEHWLCIWLTEHYQEWSLSREQGIFWAQPDLSLKQKLFLYICL